MGIRILALAIALCTGSASAQLLPDAPLPHPQPQSKLDLAFFSLDVTARSLDVVSTNHVLGQRGGYEKYLPPQIVNHTAVMVLFSGAVVAVETLGARQLRKRGHPRLARLVPVVDAAFLITGDVRNFRIGNAPAK